MDVILHLPSSWEAALDRSGRARRIVVLGPTDEGKSSFVSALAERRPGVALIDLDPGQKMIGAPGTVGLGRPGVARPERFIFLGSSAVGSFGVLAAAAADLAATAGWENLVVNTPGYVAGPGARLQAMLVGAVGPDLVVAIGAAPDLAGTARPVIAIEPSPAARRKSAARRRALRQVSFEQALAGAGTWWVPREQMAIEPAAPRPPHGEARPVCAIADEAGEALELAIVSALGAERITLFSRRPERPAARLQLGRMWAQPADSGWTLLEPLSPAWLDEA